MTYVRQSILALVLCIPVTLQAAGGTTGSDSFSTGCATVEFMAKMLAVNLLLPANHDDTAQLQSMQASLMELNRLVCQSVILHALRVTLWQWQAHFQRPLQRRLVFSQRPDVHGGCRAGCDGVLSKWTPAELSLDAWR